MKNLLVQQVKNVLNVPFWREDVVIRPEEVTIRFEEGQPVHQQPDALIGAEALDARGAHPFALLAQGGDVVGRQAGSSGFGGVPADTVSTS